jgi:hypothetical protein
MTRVDFAPKKPNTLCDQIGRAYGVLTYAQTLSGKKR